MAETATKTCHICYSTIDARAKKCPHCHSLQGIYKFVAPVLVAICIVGIFSFIGILIWAGVPPSRHRNSDRDADVQIVSSKHYFAPSSNSGKTTTIVGSLSNGSDRTIRNLDVEVRFYDTKDELIDVYTDNYYGAVRAAPGNPIQTYRTRQHPLARSRLRHAQASGQTRVCR